MCMDMPTLPDADRGIPRGGAPVNGREPRSGTAASVAARQLEATLPHTATLARTWKGLPQRTRTPASDVRSPISIRPDSSGVHDPPQESPPERHALKRSIGAP